MYSNTLQMNELIRAVSTEQSSLLSRTSMRVVSGLYHCSLRQSTIAIRMRNVSVILYKLVNEHLAHIYWCERNEMFFFSQHA